MADQPKTSASQHPQESQDTQEPEVTEAVSDTEQASPPTAPTQAPRQQNAQTGSSTSTSNGLLFTFNDIPYHKWLERMDEFNAWVNIQLAKGISLRQAFTKLCSRFTGLLGSWYLSLGAYQQL
jgi:hypothetical protein